MRFHPLRTRRIFEEVAEQITEAIRSGDLKPGDRLPPERVLAQQMEISRPTVREALKLLSDAGVLDIRPGPSGGAFVRSAKLPVSLRPAGEHELRVGEVSGVLEARRLFEPRVAELAALRATDEDFEALERTIELQRETQGDRARFLQLDYQFHLLIARATHNRTIVAMMRILLRELDIAKDLAIRRPYEPQWAIDIHERTLRAIAGADPTAIEEALDEHLGFLEKIWEEETGRARVRKIPQFLLSRAERQASG